MTDRETLEKVAEGYHRIMALQDEQRVTTAKMIRSCLAHMISSDRKKYQEGYTGLIQLADTLDPKKKD